MNIMIKNRQILLYIVTMKMRRRISIYQQLFSKNKYHCGHYIDPLNKNYQIAKQGSLRKTEG